MKEYLKMSDVFKGELFIDCDCDDVIVDELSLTVLESFSGSDAAKFALHAINSHDELVEMNKELIAKCEKMKRDSDRWKFVLDAADDMKTSRYETLCSLLRVDVDDEFDLAKQIDKARGGAA